MSGMAGSALRGGARPQAGSRPSARAAAWLLFLGPFFFLSYGMAARWTAALPHVGSIAFAWEKHIPFLAWSIVPYMSIDAFYAASLFLCASRAELDTHARRLLAATAISVAGFLLFPLRFQFVRPPTSGVCGALFELLAGFDTPYNQAPSLHISLLLLLWLVYERHLRGWLKFAMHGWFALIALSVFTTYQHHLIDGAGGLVVALACVYLFPDAPLGWSGPGVRACPARARLARRYFAGALALAACAVAAGGPGWLLLWPATSLALVALGYQWLGPSVFQKHAGQTAWAARLLLSPYQACAWLSSRWLTRAVPPGAEVVHGLWIGRAPGAGDWRRAPVCAVLDLTAEFNACRRARGLHYCSVPMLDLVAPTAQELNAATDALERLYAQGPVLVHCALGYSRSALVISAWLLRRGIGTTADEAISQVRAARPQIVLPAPMLSLLNSGPA
jgi:membrane-associated phospholipid phosphatase